MNKPRIGEPVPWFECQSPKNPRFRFHTVAGNYVVLSFLGSLRLPQIRSTIDAFFEFEDTFNVHSYRFLGVTSDSNDDSEALFEDRTFAMSLLQDFDMSLAAKFGALYEAGKVKAQTFILDERLRVVANIAITSKCYGESHLAKVLEVLSTLPPIKKGRVSDVPAPVLIVPRIFEPDFCQALIKYYDERGGKPSGFMQELDGKTVEVHNLAHKSRSDELIQDADLRNACLMRIRYRLLPEIKKAFQFNATRIERYLVACYDSESSGHFRPHRDNTTKGTAHRKFAVSINLNTGEYEGGELCFPEFGQQKYVVPAGGACVFSCSLLHEAKPVISGSRYAFLPFLYDDVAADIRRENLQFLEKSAPQLSTEEDK
ncbi:redoxin domain-containing protein [Grimontia marina]|uniref:PKHD-type hydroxylase n=1 Tax=Grimontia marina TaxID=646534 RepID=A0A128FCC4_9GAMM|nr:redoxin domain-containing protein [Grimontia marina]CZF84150.1 PKHD-type hydroxylase [Grimontia marina]